MQLSNRHAQDVFPPSVAGNIALIKRGSCEFGHKVSLAGDDAVAVEAVRLRDLVKQILCQVMNFDIIPT